MSTRHCLVQCFSAALLTESEMRNKSPVDSPQLGRGLATQTATPDPLNLPDSSVATFVRLALVWGFHVFCNMMDSLEFPSLVAARAERASNA